MKSTSQILKAFWVFILFTISSCSETLQKNTAYIKPVFDGIDIEMQEFKISSITGGTIYLENGTSLIIPPRAFCDAHGNEIEGDITLKYREFHDALDILIAGMPMAYDSGGTRYYFETAGMFEINGFYEDEPIFISTGKSLQIDFASQVDGGHYNFYELDTNNKNWTVLGLNQEVSRNTKRDELEKELGEEPKKPIIPEIITAGTKVIDFNINFDLYPEFDIIKGILWTFSGNDPAMDPEKNEWVSRTKWHDIMLTRIEDENNKFELNLVSSTKKFKTIITPVISEKNYDYHKQKFEAQIDAFNTKQKEYKAKKERLALQNEFVRSLEINSFGIYNCDIIFSRPDLIALKPQILIDGKQIDFNETPTIFHIAANGLALTQYYKNTIHSFAFSPSDENTLLVIHSVNKVAVLNYTEFNNMYSNYINDVSRKEQPLVFDLKTITKPINSKEDIKSIINYI